ncbi:MbnP family protein [Hymenobacter wooponensis]|uniref:Copper-binding protein MbnP-like domain-containing protein n=1 Tax=Hymenobacter wooponensis TaxID=1525360 RepID=A0A4Z0MSR8_9BACT|nr:MbnP family protein [Hymenobacter wooponensis]TGD82644.1 hypothetical protein EU557_02335 [Hymenobacter wooponensis]
MTLLKLPMLLLLLVAALAFTSCSDTNKEAEPSSNALNIEVSHVVGSAALVLNSATPYTTPAGDNITVSTFKYYLSNFKLRKLDGTEYVVPESYFLVDEAKAASKTITLTGIPAGDYSALTFMIGVDSTHNVSGAKAGVLDPINNMFWDWNTGYIFTKLEGNSPQAPGNHGLLLHVGGFKTPNNAIRTVSPSLGGTTIQIRKDRLPTVHMQADVLRLLSGANTIRFAEVYNIMGAGANAMKLADNYAAGMFTVQHVQER